MRHQIVRSALLLLVAAAPAAAQVPMTILSELYTATT